MQGLLVVFRCLSLFLTLFIWLCIHSLAKKYMAGDQDGYGGYIVFLSFATTTIIVIIMLLIIKSS